MDLLLIKYNNYLQIITTIVINSYLIDIYNYC